MEALRASWGQLIAAINRALNETENQILIRDSKGLTEEQISEYRKSFNHFDKVSSSFFVCVFVFCFIYLNFSNKLPGFMGRFYYFIYSFLFFF